MRLNFVESFTFLLPNIQHYHYIYMSFTVVSITLNTSFIFILRYNVCHALLWKQKRKHQHKLRCVISAVYYFASGRYFCECIPSWLRISQRLNSWWVNSCLSIKSSSMKRCYCIPLYTQTYVLCKYAEILNILFITSDFECMQFGHPGPSVNSWKLTH